MKLNPGALPAEAPPNRDGAAFAWLAPKVGGGALVLPPPNWNVLEAEPVVDGAAFPPKLNMPPEAGVEDEVEPNVGAVPLLPAKGLLIPDPEVPKLNPEFEEEPAPKLGVVVLAPLAGVEEAPLKIGAGAGVVDAALKLKMGAAGAAAASPPVNDLFAGEGPSCFMGLPSKLGADDDGDLGTPKRGLDASSEAPLGLLAPAAKLKAGAATGAEASLELGAPNKGLVAGVVETAANMLPGVVAAVLVGLAPNREPVGAAPVLAELVLGALNKEVALAAPTGFAPNRVEDSRTGAAGAEAGSAGLLTEPNMLDVEGVAGLSSDLGAPNKLGVGLTGSAALKVSVAGFCWKREAPKLGCMVGVLVSNRDFLGASSFSLSDSPPDLSFCSVVGSEDSLSAGLDVPKKLEVAVALEPKMELDGAVVVLPNSVPGWLAEAVGANLIGVVLGFHVWSAGLDAVF